MTTTPLCFGDNRASVIVQGRDFSPEAIMEALNDKTKYSDTEDLLGKDATQRLNSFSKKVTQSRHYDVQCLVRE